MTITRPKYYNIVRFYNNIGKKRMRHPEIIRTNVTLEEAQKWCNDPSTRKEGVYFDGYQRN